MKNSNKIKQIIKTLSFLFIIIIFIAASFLFVFKNFKTGVNLSISNETESQIENLKISFKYANKKTETVILSKLDAKNRTKLNLSYPKDFTEGTIILQYVDKNNKEHTENIVGYVEKGSRAESDIIIKNMDENGIIKIEIKNKDCFICW